MNRILTRFVSGSLRIEIRGEYAEKFLNLSLTQGISLSNIVRYDERRISADIIFGRYLSFAADCPCQPLPFYH